MWNDNLCRVVCVIRTWAPVPSELISVVLMYWLSSAGTGVWPLHKEPHTLELPQTQRKPFCRTYKHHQKKQVCAWCVLVSKWMSWNALTLNAPGELVSQAQIKQSPTIKRISREKDQRFRWLDLVTFEWLENFFENKLFACYLSYLSLICMTSLFFYLLETKRFIRQINYNLIKRVLNFV